MTNFSSRFSIMIMCLDMAIFAKSYAVGWIEPEFGEFRPGFDMMSFKLHAALAAFLTGIVATSENCLMPFLVFISVAFGQGFALIAFVLGVCIAFLKMGGAFPFFGFRSLFDAKHQLDSGQRISPCGFGVLLGSLAPLCGFVGALFRAEFCISARCGSEFFSAVSTLVNNWRILTFFRAVNSVTIANTAWGYSKLFPASGTMAGYSFLRFLSAALVTAFHRAILTTSVLKSGFVNHERFTAVFASGLYLISHNFS